MIFSHSDSADRFRRGQVLLTNDGQAFTVASCRPTGNGFIVRFEEVADRNASEALGKVDLFIDATARRSLGGDEYWPDELVGLEVRAESGSVVGRITEVDDSGIQVRLVIATASGQSLVPLVNELVPEIHLSEGFLVLRTLPGLLDDT